MRAAIILSAVLLALPLTAGAQKAKSRDLERFDVSGLPATPSTDIEKQIFLLLRVHRKGDLQDATRIHMLLAQYYKDIGDRARSDDCTRMATDAWEAGSKAPPETAGATGQPPFTPQRTFRRTFAYTDELNVTHTWDFYVDGTFSHKVNGEANGNGPNERGWYTRAGTKMRLWQPSPIVDRTVDFELIGPDGSDGAVLSGVRMKSGA
ncbi:MAG: hypothetical protein AB1762_12360 [Gemmatimonadota bacterium]